VSPPLRRCTKCGNEHPFTVEFFTTDRRKLSGLRPTCRPCKRVARNKLRANKLAEGAPCSAEGCKRPAIYVGLCQAHHRRKCRGLAVNRPAQDEPKLALVTALIAHYDGAADREAVDAAASRFAYWAQRGRVRPRPPRELVKPGDPRVLVLEAGEKLAEAESDAEYAAWEAVVCQYALRYVTSEWRGNDSRAA
jgi:hypothetical protein